MSNHNSVCFEKKSGKSEILKYLITFYHLLPVKRFYQWFYQLTAGPVKSKNLQPYFREMCHTHTLLSCKDIIFLLDHIKRFLLMVLSYEDPSATYLSRIAKPWAIASRHSVFETGQKSGSGTNRPHSPGKEEVGRRRRIRFRSHSFRGAKREALSDTPHAAIQIHRFRIGEI